MISRVLVVERTQRTLSWQVRTGPRQGHQGSEVGMPRGQANGATSHDGVTERERERVSWKQYTMSIYHIHLVVTKETNKN